MKILILCAHPDDLEFCIPNLLIGLSRNPEISSEQKKELNRFLFSEKRKGQSSEICVYSMTKGEMSTFTDVIKSTKRAAEIRIKELNKSQHLLTGKTPHFLNFFDGYLKVTDKAVAIIEKIIARDRPDIVLAPEPCLGYYHHPDHVATGKIAFYAVRRLRTKEKANKPILYFFQSISNDWYYPDFPFNKERIKSALAAHKSQQGILFAGSILKWFETLIHGLHIRNYTRAECLRWQPVFGTITQKTIRYRFEKMNFLKKIIYYVSKHFVDAHPVKYSVRYDKYYDGTVELEDV